MSSGAIAQTTVAPGTTFQGFANGTIASGTIVNNGTVEFAFPPHATAGFGGVIIGPGNVVITGHDVYLGIFAVSTYSGTTTVSGKNVNLVVQNGGGLPDTTVILMDGAILSGSALVGNVTVIDGHVSPGNSIGTLSIGGNLVKHRGHYHAELNAAGQSDRISVGGTATINGGTVFVLPEAGIYANSTTYTILSAAGGVTGAYTGLSADLAFLTPTLSYDANNVYLTLALQGAAFSGLASNTANHRAIGSALDRSYASASGDYATVIGALAGLPTAQGSPTLSALSSEPWANFGTTNLAGNAVFMNTLGQQMAMARGGQANSGAQRQALAQACVAQQMTNSVRSTLGMDLGGAIGPPNGRGLDMALRLGWLHEYADISRPITAAFAGAPGAAFAVYGATPQRDAAVIGFQTGTGVADNAHIYLRYDGDIGSGTDNHALSAGLRLRF